MMKRTALIMATVAALFVATTATAQSERWQMSSDNGGLVWTPSEQTLPHADHIEMSGEQVAVVLRWGVDQSGAFNSERSLVFPMLRTVPNNTHASLMHRVATDVPSLISVGGLAMKNEQVNQVEINGAVKVKSILSVGKSNIGSGRGTTPTPAIEMERTIFPTVDKAAMCEIYTLRNISDRQRIVYVPEFTQRYTTLPEKGVTGSYVVELSLAGSGTYTLAPEQELTVVATLQAYRQGEQPVVVDAEAEYKARMAFVEGDIDGALVLDTPDDVIDRAFRMAKLRASESICKTAGGYMHAPGGESYYAALWANDQAEYVNPFFPWLGYDKGNESALNSFRHFARFMNDKWEPIPSSIIAEGIDIWNGAGDRGDAAMIAYGASRYALALGDKAVAQELWPLIEWCLEYCKRKLSPAGVVMSDTDELEGRFPAGDANLCTSSLYYDALLSAAMLSKEIGKPASVARGYNKQAKVLRSNIEKHFGAEVGGYKTYRYYEGNTLLRSWICMPLTVGIYDRAEGTIAALLSDKLLSDNGVLTEEGSTTFWDRSTLYAMRGIYAAGYADKATDFLASYSRTRLLGDHVPYPIEAWPEGSQRHLSAESGLYCRIITEGLFGLRPTGLRSLEVKPSLPTEWNTMSLNKVRAFGGEFDVTVSRIEGGKVEIVLTKADGTKQSKTVAEGKSAKFVLK